MSKCCPACDGIIEVATKDNPTLFCKYCGLKVWSIFDCESPSYGLLSTIGIAMMHDMSPEELKKKVKLMLKDLRY